jgi:shikimate kinase
MKTEALIYLIGFMASGKSRVGRILAERLDYCFQDIDENIEKSEGMPIWKIFEKKGESCFRTLEGRELRRLTQIPAQRGSVIATGGGLPCDPENLSFMKAHGFIVYLRSGVEDILKRIGKTETRPVFQRLASCGDLHENVAALLKEREHYYTQADLIVPNTNDVSLEEVVERIVQGLKTVSG